MINKKLTAILTLFVFTGLFCASVYASLYKTGVTASYYAEDFHGKKTSNGERFDMNSLTCAHKSLPFNTILKVTNLANGKSVNVRVNDRGPFVVSREIDLSKAAAIKLGMIGTGTAKVSLEIVKQGPDTKLSRQTAASAEKIMKKLTGKSGTAAKKEPVLTEGTYWNIQVGAFSNKENAQKRAKALSKAGFTNIVYQKSNGITRVVLKNIPAKDVPKIRSRLEDKGFTEYTVVSAIAIN